MTQVFLFVEGQGYRVLDVPEKAESVLRQVTAGNWQRVAYKGGSEPGVLNRSTLLVAANGDRYRVVVTVNQETEPVDEAALFSAYQAILHLLAGT